MRKSVLPLGVATIIAVILISLGTRDLGRALSAFFLAPLTNTFYLSSMLSLSSLLLLSGLGIALAFSAGSFNLGGEGQSYAGGLIPAIVFTSLQVQGQSALISILMLIAGALIAALAGGIQAWIAGKVKVRLGIDPLISTFLLSSGLIPVFDALIIGPLRDESSNLLSMPALIDGLRLPALAGLPRLHAGIMLSLMFWLITWHWYRNSRLGFEINVSGANRDFAQFAGLPVKRILIIVLMMSGAFHGLAGFLALTAVQHSAVVGFTSGIGWNGIAVSLISVNKLKNLPLGALIFSYLITASNAAMVFTDFSFELSTVIQAVVFLLVSVNLALPRLARKREAVES